MVYGRYRKYKRTQRRYYKKKFGANYSMSSYRKFNGFNKRRKLVNAKFTYGRPGATELKTLDTAFTLSPITNPGGVPNVNGANQCVQYLNIVGIGASFWNRIANRIRMKSLHIKAQFFQSSAAVEVKDTVVFRVMIVYDRQSNGVALTSLQDLIQSVDLAGAAVSPTQYPLVFQQKNQTNKDRFQILMDKSYTLGATRAAADSPHIIGVTTGVKGQYTIDKYLRLKDMETHFKANIAADSNAFNTISTGSLMLVAWTDAVSAGTTYDIQGTARLMFRD